MPGSDLLARSEGLEPKPLDPKPEKWGHQNHPVTPNQEVVGSNPVARGFSTEADRIANPVQPTRP